LASTKEEHLDGRSSGVKVSEPKCEEGKLGDKWDSWKLPVPRRKKNVQEHKNGM